MKNMIFNSKLRDGFLYVIGVTVYSMEGAGLILSLKASCQKPEKFASLLTSTLAVLSIFMAIFGCAGYIAFGDETRAPITLNISGDMSTTFVKIALCLGLYLTFPIMMFPSKRKVLNIARVVCLKKPHT